MKKIERAFDENSGQEDSRITESTSLFEFNPFGKDISNFSEALMTLTPSSPGITPGNMAFPAAASDIGKNWRVTIIESGVSDNNNWYRPSVLKEAIPVFEGAPIRIYEYDGRTHPRTGEVFKTFNDHMPAWVHARDAGVITGNTVGALRNVRLEDVVSLRQGGRMVPALVSDLCVIDPPTRSKLVEAWNAGLMDTNKRALFELSIEADGPHTRVYEGQRMIKQVQGISNVKEVTIVTRGAAGGRFLAMLNNKESEAKRESGFNKQEIEHSFDKLSFREAFGKGGFKKKPQLPQDPTETTDPVPAEQPSKLPDDQNKDDQDQNPEQSGQTEQEQPNQNNVDPNKPIDPNNPNQKENPFSKNQPQNSDPNSPNNLDPTNPNMNDEGQQLDEEGNPLKQVDPTLPNVQTREQKIAKLKKDAASIDLSKMDSGQKALSLLRSGNLEMGIEILEDLFDIAKHQNQSKNGNPAPLDKHQGDGMLLGYGTEGNKKDSLLGTLDLDDEDDDEGDESDDEENVSQGDDSKNNQKNSKPNGSEERGSGNNNFSSNSSSQSDQPDQKKKLKKKPAFLKESGYNKMETEPNHMKTQNTEPSANSGSDLQNGTPATVAYSEYVKLQESIQNNQEELLNFSQFMAQRENENQARFQESLDELKALREWQANQNAQAEASRCRNVLAFRLRESNLPVPTQALVAEEFEGYIESGVFSESKLLSRIDQNRKHIYKLAESSFLGNGASGGGLPAGMQISGGQRISYGRNGIDWFRAEVDRAFGYDPKLDKGLSESDRDTYAQLPSQPSLLRPLKMWHDDDNFNCISRHVGPNALLREATSLSAGLSVALQNSMTKSLMQKFMMQPALWREVCQTENVANYLTQQRIVLGGLGRLPQVVEAGTGTTYLSLGIPSSDQMTYGLKNYGGLIEITRQAILNDNLGVIQAYPQQVAETAIMELNLQVFGTLIGMYGTGATPGTINTATSYTGKVIYDAAHNNVSSDPLGYDAIIDALNRLSEQRKFGNVGYLASDITAGDNTFAVTTSEFANALKNEAKGTVLINGYKVKVASVSGTTVTITTTFPANISSASGTLRIEQLSSPIAFQRALLVIPTQLRHIAFQLMASTLDPSGSGNGASFLAPFYANKELLPLAINSMYLGDDTNNWYIAADKPVIIGFLGGREDPQLLLQDNPLVGNVFAGDLLSYKCFHEYGTTLNGHLSVQAGIL